MKKLLCIVLALLIFPAAAAAEYTPALQMTIQEFIYKYNQQPAALSSPYQLLTDPYTWTGQPYPAAYFYPENDKCVSIILFTNDPDHMESLESGLDSVRIFASDPDAWLSLLTVTKRCMSVFHSDDSGIFLPRALFSLMDYYHDNSTGAGYAGSKISFGYLNEYTLALSGNSFWIRKVSE